MPHNAGDSIDDIEDLIGEGNEADIRVGNKKSVLPRARKFKKKDDSDTGTNPSADSIIPGTVKSLKREPK